MRRKLFILLVALLMASMIGIAAGPAWGQNQAGCEGTNEGDHGRGCLPTTKEEECKEGAWEVFKVFEHLFENVEVCD
jgi:hypothetical protein